jgi:small subunit ribosomal protein S16
MKAVCCACGRNSKLLKTVPSEITVACCFSFPGNYVEYATFAAGLVVERGVFIYFKLRNWGLNAMVTIRLARGGGKSRPFYNVVVTDSRSKRDGRFIEQIGFFNPMAREHEIRTRIDFERMTYWVSKGAQPSDRVAQLAKVLKKQTAAVVAA